MPTQNIRSKWTFDMIIFFGNFLSLVVFNPVGLLLFAGFISNFLPVYSTNASNFFLEYFIVGVPVTIVASQLIQFLRITWLARLISFGTFFAFFALEILPGLGYQLIVNLS